jgi:hypothetical protein
VALNQSRIKREKMQIRYAEGDIQIGSIVKMKIDHDMKGIVTGIQFRDQCYVYMVTFIVNGASVEYFCRPIEILNLSKASQ